VDFCSALETEWISGFKFHPERSGGAGLQIYRNLAARLQQTRW
jgi:imidazoleglycerol phosphate synthase glutamine amidotransferase subunit HisH